MTAKNSHPGLIKNYSPEKGHGVFTTQPVKAGSPILAFVGPVRPSSDIPFQDTTHCLEIADGWYLTSSGEFDDFINHSCDPNCGLRFSGELGSHEIMLFALHDIPEGTELTFDYSTYLSGRFEPFPCACGSANCRKQVGAFRDLPPDIRARYLEAGIVAPYLRRFGVS